ncbi:hypothetical protein HLQ61_003967, partial [Shigella sonnei]|nr:hypothetical protein [Shigella sonnei]
RKIDTGKTLTRWPVFVDHFTHFLEKSMVRNWISNSVPGLLLIYVGV